jgi:predicted MFS family arabinose efflux permease
MTIGGFWSLATATIMRLVPEGSVPKALGVLYTGNAVATAFAAPIGSYLGGIIGWRGVFWALAPIVLVNLIWQWMSLPAMPPRTASASEREHHGEHGDPHPGECAPTVSTAPFQQAEEFADWMAAGR